MIANVSTTTSATSAAADAAAAVSSDLIGTTLAHSERPHAEPSPQRISSHSPLLTSVLPVLVLVLVLALGASKDADQTVCTG